jgi:serine-type D-Ala-D-Ala carboxypeptidase/endopeptidase
VTVDDREEARPGAGGLAAAGTAGELVDDLARRAMRSGRRVGLVVGYLTGGDQVRQGERGVAGYGRVVGAAAPGAPDASRPLDAVAPPDPAATADPSGPPDAGTLFEIGSITKVFTGLLLADLAANDVVGLDDPLGRYLPTSISVPSFQGREITLADLASHAAGLPRNPKGMLRSWLRDRRNPFASLTDEDVQQGLARTRLRRRPGERARYSNLGAGLLGQALATAAGQPYERLVAERVCRPLGMADTVVDPTGDQAPRLAVGHTRRGRPVPPFQIPALPGAGALRSTAADMLRFLEANLDPAGTPLAAELERIQRPRVRMGRGIEMGLGWLIVRSPEPNGPLLWHNGGTSGFRSFAAVLRHRGTGVVVLSNSARSVDRLGLRLVKALATDAG